MPAWKISTPSIFSARSKPAMRVALVVVAGIALRGHHHRQRRIREPAQIEILRAARHSRQSAPATDPTSYGPSAPDTRIAEPGIVFDEFRPLLGHHDRRHRSRPQKASPMALSARRVGMIIVVHHLRAERLGHNRRRRIGAHATSVRALVAVEGALVVLRSCQRQRVLRHRTARRTRLPRPARTPRSRLPHRPRRSRHRTSCRPRPAPRLRTSPPQRPLPAARPSALTTIGAPWARI